MASEVGSGQVAIFPTFKGFRQAVTSETDGAASAAGSSFDGGFRKATAKTGASAGKDFKNTFSSAASGLATSSIAQLTSEVAHASASLSTARLKEQDSTGKVRVAEAALSEARSKGAADSAKVISAEEKLASAQRAAVTSTQSVTTASSRLSSSQNQLAEATAAASSEAVRTGSRFSALSGVFGSAGRLGGSKFSQGFKDVLGGALGANILTGIGFTIGRGINDGIQGAIGLGLKSIGLQSDVVETTQAVSQIFGKTATDNILKFTSTAATSLGETQEDALKAAQTFGVFGKSAGLQGAKLSDFSDGLTTLAGDLASFYNTTPQEASDAIASGLRGQSKPLRAYGVLLDAQTLKNKAFALGIYSGSGALTGQQRILAAQAVIMEQTGVAQGDFARTSGGLANQQRILQASITETETKLGEALYPAFTKIVGYANSTLIPAVGNLIDTVGPQLSQALTDAGPGFKDLETKAGPVLAKLITAAGTKGVPALVTALDNLIDAAPEFKKAFKGGEEVIGWLNDLPDLVGPLTNVDKQVQNFGKDLAAAFSPGGSLSNADWSNGTDQIVAQQLKDFKGNFTDLPKVIRDNLTAGAKETGAGATQIANAFSTLSSDQLVFLASYTGNFANLPDSIKSKFTDASTLLTPAGIALMQGLQNGIADKAAGDAVAAAAVLVVDNAKRAAKHAAGIQSPSKVWRKEIGLQLGTGVSLGIDDASGLVAASARGLMALPSLAMSGASSTSGSTSKAAALAASAGGNVYIDKIVAPDQNPVVSGRIMGREFLRVKAG